MEAAGGAEAAGGTDEEGTARVGSAADKLVAAEAKSRRSPYDKPRRRRRLAARQNRTCGMRSNQPRILPMQTTFGARASTIPHRQPPRCCGHVLSPSPVSGPYPAHSVCRLSKRAHQESTGYNNLLDPPATVPILPLRAELSNRPLRRSGEKRVQGHGGAVRTLHAADAMGCVDVSAKAIHRAGTAAALGTLPITILMEAEKEKGNVVHQPVDGPQRAEQRAPWPPGKEHGDHDQDEDRDLQPR